MKTALIVILYIIAAAPLAVSPQGLKPRNNVLLQGIIIDGDVKQPLGYASIGILNKPVGTVSDSLGHFELAVDNQYPGDTLQVSIVGYYPVKHTIRELLNVNGPIVISLAKKVTRLNEVVVTNPLQHTIIVGRQSTGSFLQASIVPKGDKAPIIGAESGLKIHIDGYPARLENLNFYVSRNNFKYVRFRVNMYSIKHNLPDTLLFNKEILVSLNNYKTGWTQINLAPYHLVITDDCAVTLQWVDYNKDMVAAPLILIPASPSFSHINYYRPASQDKWKSIRGNVSFYLTLKD
jgi:hypothetical protein